MSRALSASLGLEVESNDGQKQAELWPSSLLWWLTWLGPCHGHDQFSMLMTSVVTLLDLPVACLAAPECPTTEWLLRGSDHERPHLELEQGELNQLECVSVIGWLQEWVNNH